MLKSAQRNKISPLGLFYIIFVSRTVVCLTSVHSVSKSNIKPDALISYVMAMCFTVLLSVPAIMCCKKGKNPIALKPLKPAYCLFFIFAAAVNVSRFSYFASTVLNPETQGWFFALIICACAFYAVKLKIEALSRFSAFCFVLLVLAICAVLLCNIKSFEAVNLYPTVTSSRRALLENATVFASNTTEIAMLLCIFPTVNGPFERSFVRGITSAFFAVFMLLLFLTAVLGDGASVQTFPFYELFRVSKFSSFERLDVLHISFWIMGVFVKATALHYCSKKSLRGIDVKHKDFTISIAVFVISLLLLRVNLNINAQIKFAMALFFIFCVIIPLLVLIFKKKSCGDIFDEGC